MGHNPIPPLSAKAPTEAELLEGNLRYLREKYAVGFITLDELETGLESVLAGGAINVPRAKEIA